MITRDKEGERGKECSKGRTIRDLTNACKWFKEKGQDRVCSFFPPLAFIHSISYNSGTRSMKSVVSLLVLLYLIKIQERASVLMVPMSYIYANRVRITRKQTHRCLNYKRPLLRLNKLPLLSHHSIPLKSGMGHKGLVRSKSPLPYCILFF